jgi:hypothetical protein
MMCEPEHACMTSADMPVKALAAEFGTGEPLGTAALPPLAPTLSRLANAALAARAVAVATGRVTGGDTYVAGRPLAEMAAAFADELERLVEAVGGDVSPTGQRTSTGPVTPGGPTPNGSWTSSGPPATPAGYRESRTGIHRVYTPPGMR